jgi:hypothetical protein
MPKLNPKSKTKLKMSKAQATKTKTTSKGDDVKPTSESLSVFNRHKPVDNICLASVRFQTKKAAREALDKDSSAELYIKTVKDGSTTKESIFKRCRKTKKDGQEFCWKHYETMKNRKHPVIHFQKDIIEQLGKTVRNAVVTDSFLMTGSVSSRKVEEANIVASQPIFTMKPDMVMFEELKKIQDQITAILERGSVASTSSSSDVESEPEESEPEESEPEETKAKPESEKSDIETSENEEDEELESGSEKEVEAEIIYTNRGEKYYHDELSNSIIELDGTVVGGLYQIDYEDAPFIIKEKRYIVKQRTKVGGKRHIRCKISNLVFDMSHEFVGTLVEDDGKMRLERVKS